MGSSALERNDFPAAVPEFGKHAAGDGFVAIDVAVGNDIIVRIALIFSDAIGKARLQVDDAEAAVFGFADDGVVGTVWESHVV